jgi:uncharacterized membrane protein
MLMSIHEKIHADRVNNHRLVVKSYRARADASRSVLDKVADKLTTWFGSMPFLVANFIWFAAWISINTGLIPGVSIFDPFPFGLLTMIVSLEAIGLAIIVLITQNRGAKIAEVREEIDLQITSIAETEITKVINMLHLLLEKNGIKLDDPDLEDMLRPIRSEDIERVLEKQLR